jgi:SAM-dependent methyltransferase
VRLLERIHHAYVFPRRVRVLSSHLARLVPHDARIVDIGSGDGSIAASLLERRPDVTVQGLDVFARPRPQIPVRIFDGTMLPFPDRSFDVATLVDVVHHAERPLELLREAMRVSPACIVLKDHTLEGAFAETTLRFMDRVGNVRHGVAIPYSFWSKTRWLAVFAELGLRVDVWESSLGLYPPPANLLFDRSLHFIARVERA